MKNKCNTEWKWSQVCKYHGSNLLTKISHLSLSNYHTENSFNEYFFSSKFFIY